MRKTYHWTLVFGLILFICGVLIVVSVIQKNLPSSLDRVNAPEMKGLPVSVNPPASSSVASEVLEFTPTPSPNVYSTEENDPTSVGSPLDIPTTIQTATPTVVPEENLALTSSAAPDELLFPTLTITPTANGGGISTQTRSTPPEETASLVLTSTEATVSDLPTLPAKTPVLHPIGFIPDRLVISSINLDVPIMPVGVKQVEFGGKVLYQWLTPEQYAVGWHNTSALLGLPGNTVINGHHNAYGMPFKYLVKLEVGDILRIYSGSQEFRYQVVANLVFPEHYESLATRIENARWIEPSQDERITLITCWPENSNTLRVVIVALPTG